MAALDHRLELDAILRDILGNNNTYFEPPTSVTMHYPCIRYRRSNIDSIYADNKIYLKNKRYELILIYEDADSDLPDKLMDTVTATHDRHYVADNLHHDVFSMYF
ncbi:MAG: hypothetical protein IKW90_15130 [Lachnospiraceae bacterium]|nr:hypothetical protein [Lachnospiraceae bacterium]